MSWISRADRYVAGWRTYLRCILVALRKEQGAGRPSLSQAHQVAMISRWIVDGQHRGGAHPFSDFSK